MSSLPSPRSITVLNRKYGGEVSDVCKISPFSERTLIVDAGDDATAGGGDAMLDHE